MMRETTGRGDGAAEVQDGEKRTGCWYCSWRTADLPLHAIIMRCRRRGMTACRCDAEPTYGSNPHRRGGDRQGGGGVFCKPLVSVVQYIPYFCYALALQHSEHNEHSAPRRPPNRLILENGSNFETVREESRYLFCKYKVVQTVPSLSTLQKIILDFYEPL